jgi:hypothetical protein
MRHYTDAPIRSSWLIPWFSFTTYFIPEYEVCPYMAETTDARSPAEQADPATALRQMMNGYWITQIVRAAADLRLADHISAGARTAEEIAERESSDPATTHRLMRACASLGLLAHDGERRFSTTHMGELLRSDTTGSLRETALSSGSPAFWLPWGHLPEAVRKGESQSLTALGMTAMDYFAEHPDEGAHFTASMSSLTATVVGQVVRLIDTSETSLAVDVGGADGELLRGLMLANPDLYGQVFDLPHVIREARKGVQKPELAERLSFVEGDFFDSVPPADLYLLKAVLHGQDDDSCVRILGNCRAAARPDARLVVIENVISDTGDPGVTALLDINMLAVSGGQERDVAEYDALFAASGWRRVAIHRTRGPRSLLELRPAD